MQIYTRMLRGFSLIEVLVTLAVLMSLITIGVPNLINFTITLKVDSEISRLYNLLLTARNTAINTGKIDHTLSAQQSK